MAMVAYEPQRKGVEMAMSTTQEITRVWLNEGLSTGAAGADKPGRYLWSWPVQVEVGDAVEYCQSRAIWDGGIEFEIKRELPVGSHVRIRRQLRSVEPWVDVRIEAAVSDEDGTVIVDGSFHA